MQVSHSFPHLDRGLKELLSLTKCGTEECVILAAYLRFCPASVEDDGYTTHFKGRRIKLHIHSQTSQVCTNRPNKVCINLTI